MNNSMSRSMRVIFKSLVGVFTLLLAISLNTTTANAYAGTLENGNLAYAQSEFNKGEACNYLPGFETGYDAWHFVLTSRGATFQQDPKNPAIAINLNLVFMRQDGSLFTIKSGAWVQTGKGAYTYTPVQDKIRMVQAGSLAQINGLDSGMRLSHTCPGTGSAVTPTPSPTPTTSSTPTASPTPTATKSTTPTPTPTTTTSATPTPSPSVSATPTPTSSASPSPSVTPTPTPSPSSTVIPTRGPRPNPTASAVQVHPTGTRSPLPTPSATPQGLEPTPTPSATPTKSSTPTPAPTNTPEPTTSPEPTTEPSPKPTVIIPPVLPTPPPVEEPKKLIFVEPQTPTVVPPQTLPEPPSTSPIVITKQPEYGTVTVAKSGEITYTSNLTDTKSTKVDVVEITYTSLSGKVVVVRKQFILAQKGDVPSIIQTGYPDSNKMPFEFVFILLAATTAFVIRKKGRNNEA